MSLVSRVKMIARAKSHTALDALEQPEDLFNYAIEEQRALVRKINRSLVEVATSRQRLERQIATLQARIPKLEAQAKQAITVGREDLARTVLEQKQTALAEIAEIERTSRELEEEEQQLSTAARQLWSRIEQFSTRRTIVTARYDAASARVRAGEALTGISGDLADLSAAIHRAEERTERFTSRANAIETLVVTGELALPFSPNRVEAELQSIAASQAVDDELRQLRESLPIAITAGTE
jgi:phage shock protein A